jgi:hypothetical protein
MREQVMTAVCRKPNKDQLDEAEQVLMRVKCGFFEAREQFGWEK